MHCENFKSALGAVLNKCELDVNRIQLIRLFSAMVIFGEAKVSCLSLHNIRPLNN